MTPLRKPAPGSGRAERYERKVARRGVREKAERSSAASRRREDRAIRWECYLRDNRRCRAFGTPLLFETDNLKKLAENHHVIPRSACGSDAMENRITLSPKAHRMRHDALLDVEGNANGAVTFTEWKFVGAERIEVRTWQTSPPRL